MERAPPAYMGRPRRKPPSPGRQWFVARRFPTLVAASSFQPPLHRTTNQCHTETFMLVCVEGPPWVVSGHVSLRPGAATYLVAGAKFGCAMATFVESQRGKTSMRVAWT